MNESSGTLFIMFLALCHLSISDTQLGIGDSCQTHDNYPGVCSIISKCDELRNLPPEASPATCSFTKEYEPIICCKKSTPQTRPSIKSRNYFPARTPVTLSKSEEKCKEYGKLIYFKRPAPIPGDPPIQERRCGIEVKKLIVGGDPADRLEFPHMALLGYGPSRKRDWLCAGSLISERFVLTAAHCSRSNNVPVSVVKLGVTDLRNLKDKGLQEIPVSQIINHPEYAAPRLYNDIALLRLNRKVIMTEYVRPACLHTKFGTDTKKAIASGWGKVSFEANNGTDMLMKVELSLQPSHICKRTYPPNRTNRRTLPNGLDGRTQICAGEYDGGKDACQGDSGGPLQIYNKDVSCMYSIVGITSFGDRCGVVPGVYTRVSHYIPWIERIVWP